MTPKERFTEIYKTNITREGADRFFDYLNSNQSDFFEAPASTFYHGAVAGGLLEHSLNVYDCLKDYLDRKRVKDEYCMNYSEETIALVALLHDVCKINVYQMYMKNVKNEYGVWEAVPAYRFEDPLPYGHGEKSVYILSGYMKLTREEAFAIRYHMGFAKEQDVKDYGKVCEMFPLAFALNVADSEAAFFIEGSNN